MPQLPELNIERFGASLLESPDAGVCIVNQPPPAGYVPGPGALRGASGCNAPALTCGTGEYSVHVGCVLEADGGTREAWGRTAGNWCFALPSHCPSTLSATEMSVCLKTYGVLASTCYQLPCPGSYVTTTENSQYCNPP